MSICISTHCKKYFTCRKAHPNDNKIHQAINWHNYGTFSTGMPTYKEDGTFTYDNAVEHYCCGEKGNYAMYEPIE